MVKILYFHFVIYFSTVAAGCYSLTFMVSNETCLKHFPLCPTLITPSSPAQIRELKMLMQLEKPLQFWTYLKSNVNSGKNALNPHLKF